MGMFDDLIPQQGGGQAPAPPSRGMFDDLIPTPRNNQPPGPHIIPLDNAPQTTQERQFANDLRQRGSREYLDRIGYSPGAAVVTSAANTLGLNIPRNVGAAVRTLKTGKSFADEYDFLKQADEAAAVAYPGRTLAGTAVGALGQAAALPIAPAATMAGRAFQGAKTGAALGGASELIDSKDPMQAARAAGMGFALGGIASPLVEGGVAAARAAGQSLRGFANPSGEAASRIATALERDAAVGGQQLDDAALQAAQARGQPAVVADMGGETTRALARSAANTSPEARHALQNAVGGRFESQAPRVSEFVLNLGSGEDAFATREALKLAASRANKPAYDRAYAQGAGGVWNQGLSQLATAPDVAQAIKQATRTGANKAAAEGFRPVKNPFQELPSGEVTLRDPNVTPTLQFWDAVKQNLDDRINSLQRAGENSAAKDAINLKNQLVSYLDEAAPAYANARAGAAKFFGAQDALEAGEKFVTARGKNSEYAAAISKMSEPERKLFADGFASKLSASINEAGDRRSILNSIFNSPSARQRVNMALGTERAKEFEAFMHVESMMDDLRKAVTGNSTTVRQLAEAGLAGGLAGGVFGGGDPRNISLGAALGAAARTGKIKIDQRVAQRVGEMLSSSDPEVFRRAVRMVAKNEGLKNAVKAFGARLSAVLGSTIPDRMEN